jgi:hypothetical protein
MIRFLLWAIKNPNNYVEGLWCGPGLNRRHKDFQSFALPTELPHHSYELSRYRSSSGRCFLKLLRRYEKLPPHQSNTDIKQRM